MSQVEIASWNMHCSLGGPDRFNVELLLPETGLDWDFKASEGLAHLIHDYVHGRTTPRWRRVWNALVGR
ncbi:hypothetical protein MycrhDRAFT_5785 [Mycolicibacterium rhodesiae JS60]|nr:hypothetical protein MycrhDRAFT_5785 [Mycolicibacterium rhodesiae JS60]